MDKETRKLIEDVEKIVGVEYLNTEDSAYEKLSCALRDLRDAYNKVYDEKDDLHRELMDYQQHSHNYNW